MDEPLVPDAVERVLGRVHSVFELELLLLLRELPDQEWSPAALASMLDSQASLTRTALVNLSREGLIERRYGGESLSFRFDSSQPTARAADQLASLYLEHRTLIISLIETRPRSNLQRFSDAFRLRKEP